MSTKVINRIANISHMGKKQTADNAAKRINVGFPEEWHAVARKLAASHKQPVLYFFISLLEKAAEENGLKELPKRPWEEE